MTMTEWEVLLLFGMNITMGTTTRCGVTLPFLAESRYLANDSFVTWKVIWILE
jgi:hypothetical protein